MKQTESEILLHKFLSLPEIAREYIRICIESPEQRAKITNELFDAFLDYKNSN